VNTARRFQRRVAPHGECWVWTGATEHNGYARFWLDGKMRYAHRVAYEWFRGPIPAGLDLDHLCRVRNCVNPYHLEAVTRQVNLLRGETFTAAHAAGRDCGFPKCRACRRFRVAA
jgi:hypothetical protein